MKQQPAAIQENRVYISDKVFTVLCPEGQRLHDAWTDALENEADKDIVYKAMQAYFTHRNGVLTKNYSKVDMNFCPECSAWLEEEK